MSAQSIPSKMSEVEYLAFERTSELKHEYVNKVKKLREYRQIESLQEYLIIAQDGPVIERYLRQENGDWLYSEISGMESNIKLPSLEISLEFAAIYKKLEFSEGSGES